MEPKEDKIPFTDKIHILFYVIGCGIVLVFVFVKLAINGGLKGYLEQTKRRMNRNGRDIK